MQVQMQVQINEQQELKDELAFKLVIARNGLFLKAERNFQPFK